MSAIVFLYTTAPDESVAKAIAEALVGAGAAACVNILPDITSIYRWEGRIEKASEAVLIAKTTSNRAAAAREIVLANHPYETPAIVAIPIDRALSSEDFCAWIEENCGQRISATLP